MSKSGADHVSLNPARDSNVKPNFPEGLRVLCVDDNVVCLKVIAALLQKCRYIVTVTTKATEALEMLRMNKESYDIVITDVKMLDMDGFELLEKIGLEMDMPVIMMSANDDTESVMTGVKHGARDYLVKPVRVEELRNIWQHVLRKNLVNPLRLGTKKEGKDQNPMPSKRQREKGKEKEKEKDEEASSQLDGENSGPKKQRVNWSKELHNKFVDVVQQLGVEKAVPKKILEKMNEPRLSRENVGSHLQKFRKLLRKQSEQPTKDQENENNSDPRKTNVHLSDPNTILANNRGLITSFANRNRTFGDYLANRRPPSYNSNLHEFSFQQNVVPPQVVADQTRPNMPDFRTNSFRQPELDWMRFQANFSRTNMVDDYVPLHMLGDGSTQLDQFSKPDSLAMMVPNSSQGQYEGNSVNFNGRGETSGFPYEMRGQIIDESTQNGDQYVVQNNSENFISLLDDDLSVIVRQFSSNAPPPKL